MKTYKDITFTTDVTVYVDWGDSNNIKYPKGTITGTPKGPVKIRTAEDIKTLKFTGNAIQTASILSGYTLENMNQAFINHTNLRTFGFVGANNIKNWESTWEGCTGLKTWRVDSLNNGNNFNRTFYGCSGLEAIEMFNSKNGTAFNSTFMNTGLRCIGLVDTTKQISTLNMFTNTDLNKPDNLEILTILDGTRWFSQDNCPNCSEGVVLNETNIPTIFPGGD